MVEDSVCLLGFGRIGFAAATLLAEEGIEVVVYDASMARVEAARRRGFEAHLADASSPRAAAQIAERCRVAATALPGRVAEAVVPRLVEAGIATIVDVSYVRDPFAYEEAARKRDSVVYVDAGLAPGLSNMLAARLAQGILRPLLVHVYVGGLAAEPKTPLGLVASWNIEDLLEEYTRPARARINGEPAQLDPIADATTVTIPGHGEFEALPTDGLRTLLRTLKEPSTLIEYTLRYPGHVALLRSLRELGLLEERSYVVEGCASPPRSLLARLLEERLPQSGDRVVLYVVAEGEDRGGGLVRAEYYLDVTQQELGLPDEMTALAYLTGLVFAWFVLQALREPRREPGVVPPEALAGIVHELIGRLRARGVTVSKRVCVVER